MNTAALLSQVNIAKKVASLITATKSMKVGTIKRENCFSLIAGEGVLGFSGVLATIVLGVTLSAEKTNISQDMEAFHNKLEKLFYFQR